MSDAAGGRTPEEEALAGEIERTREQLGETVEALAAKADVKGRAQHRVAEAKGNLRGKAHAAKDKVTGQAAATAAQAKDTAQATAARAKDTSTPVRRQVATGAAGAAQAVRGITPAPVQRSAGQAVAIMRTNRGKVASASLAALVVLAWLAMRRRR